MHSYRAWLKHFKLGLTQRCSVDWLGTNITNSTVQCTAFTETSMHWSSPMLSDRNQHRWLAHCSHTNINVTAGIASLRCRFHDWPAGLQMYIDDIRQVSIATLSLSL